LNQPLRETGIGWGQGKVGKARRSYPGNRFVLPGIGVPLSLHFYEFNDEWAARVVERYQVSPHRGHHEPQLFGQFSSGCLKLSLATLQLSPREFP